MSRRSTVNGGARGWPGTSSQLASGAGTAVTVGSGLSLSGGTLATADIGCRVYNSANIAVATATVVYFTFNSEDYDTDSMHSTSSNTGRITINTAGKYYLYFNVELSGVSVAAVSAREAFIRKSGSTVVAYTSFIMPASTAATSRLVAYTERDCAVGDYFEAGAYQDSGSSLNANAASYSLYFGARRVA